jgi:hypothetical protein
MQQVAKSVPCKLGSFFKYLKYNREKKNIKKIKTGSPSFGVLWNFADFIKYAEIIFFYDNNKNGTLFSSTGYNPQENGFRINGVECVITVKLFSEYQRVGIDIESKHGNKLKRNYTFEENQWTIEPDEYDVLLIDRITEIINNSMIGLLQWCIDVKNYKKVEAD